jgi:membrane peptidoglycan carboxypeptidase
MGSTKRLGGKPPRRRRGLAGDGRAKQPSSGTASLLFVLAVAFFVLGGVAGFGWSLDRQIRGGLLRQQREAVQRPDWVRLERLPEYVPAAFVAVVDPSFIQEGAIRGGRRTTTLSRELVRQVHLLPDDVSGEARELLMGPILEQRTSRRGLLEVFLNRVYLGDQRGYPIFGVHHAAREYFDTEPEQLTLGETATLAGLLLEPRITDPENRVGAVGVRRNEVLRVMLAGGMVSEEQFRAAVAEPLGFQPGLERQPMSRPADWMEEPAPIRLPEELRPRPDSAEANPAPGSPAPR